MSNTQHARKITLRFDREDVATLHRAVMRSIMVMSQGHTGEDRDEVRRLRTLLDQLEDAQ